MRLNSIRWRLPISYAAIALLAALSLGTVLLGTLRGYYAQREKDYLSGNAAAIGASLTPMVEANLPSPVIQSQLENFSFLSQVRVQLLDPGGRVLATSAEPGSFDVSVVAVPIASVASLPWDGADWGPIDYWSFIAIRQQRKGTAEPWQTFDHHQAVGKGDSIFLQPLTAAGTLYGYDLGSQEAAGGPRSSQVVRQPLADSSGRVLGYIQLSEGPAYGREVVGRVALAWAIAGLVAVLLAAAAGWVVSRQMGTPLVALAGTTARMAAGDLSARAEAGRRPLEELRLLAGSFNHMAGQVEETIVTLRRFVSDAAHELHTPLTALRTNLELAAEEGEDSRVFLERAQAQVDRLERLASGLLDLSRLEAGPAPHVEPVDLAGLVRHASEAYASQVEQAGLVFALDLPAGGAPVTVRGDDLQLRRAVDNLVDNAVKFTPEGGTVSVGVRPGGEDGRDYAELWVADTGIGIPAGDLPQVFSRFHRGRNAAAYPGNGLGLAIVKAIAESHDGQVTAENTGHGSRFTLRLPAAA